MLLPAGYDDPDRPSGGSTYDGRLATGLADHGWRVVVHKIPQGWPAPDAEIEGVVDLELASIPAERVVVVDGLLCTAAEAAFVRHAARLRLVALVHMPGQPGGPPGAVLHAARLIVTTSGWTARVLVEQHALPISKVLAAPPGAPAAELTTGTASGGNLLCVAAVTHAKGLDLLFAALAALSSLTWTCTCVGSLDREPAFVDDQRAQLADLGIAARIVFTGALAGADLDRAFGSADVLILPTRNESYGLVVTEALARGVPVIATAIGGVPEALGLAEDGRLPGILVEADDVRALGAAIAQWLSSPMQRVELRSAALSRRAMLRGWDHPVSIMSTALGRLAAGPPAAS